MIRPRWFDWRLCVAMIGLVLVATLCYNSVKATQRADSLVRIAEENAAQSRSSAARIVELQEKLDQRARIADKRAKVSTTQVSRIQQQNRAQRRQIDLLVRYLRVNGLDVPRIEVLPMPSPRRSAPPSTQPSTSATPDQPGRSDAHRNKPKNPKGKP